MRARNHLVLALTLLSVLPKVLRAQSATPAAPESGAVARAAYNVDLHAASGPMAIYWWRGRLVPANGLVEYKPSLTIGYSILGRAMWHPDHLLELGVLTGYQLLVTERYSLTDSSGTSPVHGRLTATPVMIDVAMTGGDLEIGLAIGGSILSTTLDDKTRAEATRLELGSILHGQYSWHLADRLTLGAGMSVGYMGYRGLLLFTPQLELSYALLTY